MDPSAPVLGTPRLVHPEKAALQQVFAEPQHFLAAELGAARVFDEQQRTMEEHWIVETDDHVPRLAIGSKFHRNARELGEPDREVVVGRWVVRIPSAAAA